MSRRRGRAPPVDLTLEKNAGETIRELIAAGLVSAVHDISDGGLAVALMEMAIASGLGADVAGNDDYTAAQWWFGEDQGRYVITVPDTEAFNAQMAKGTRDEDMARVGFRRLGTVGGDELLGVPVADLREAHQRFFAEWMEG